MEYKKIPNMIEVGGVNISVKKVERCDDNCLLEYKFASGIIEIEQIMQWYFIRVDNAKSYHKAWQKLLAEKARQFNGRMIEKEEIPEMVSVLREEMRGVQNCGEIREPRFGRLDMPEQYKYISAEDYSIVLIPVFGWWNGGAIHR